VLLVGITLNLLIGALFSLWQFLFLAFNYPFPSEMWFGHFRFASLESLLLISGIQLLGLYFLRTQFPSLILFSLGPQVARNWGLETNRLLKRIFIFAAVSTAAVVGLFGAFSFLALVFPILSRRLWFRRGDLKGELLLGSFANGLFLMAIDLLCYQFPIMGAEVPVGLIMSAAGALSLIVLIWQGHKD
jgi:iron complex transport system permease protein